VGDHGRAVEEEITAKGDHEVRIVGWIHSQRRAVRIDGVEP